MAGEVQERYPWSEVARIAWKITGDEKIGENKAGRTAGKIKIEKYKYWNLGEKDRTKGIGKGVSFTAKS